MEEYRDDELVCHCFSVTRKTIIDTIKQYNLTTADEVGEHTQAGCGCGFCVEDIEKIIEELKKESK